MRCARYVMITWAIWLVPMLLSAHDIPTYQLAVGQSGLDINTEEVALLIDNTGRVNVDDILRGDEALYMEDGGEVFTASTANHWVVFKLEKNAQEEFRQFVLEIGNAHLAQYDIYFADEDGVVASFRQGDNFPFSQREIAHNYFLHNIPDIESDIITVLLRVNNEGQEIWLPIKIEDRNSYLKQNTNTKLFHGFVMGLFLITTIITTILFFIYRDRFYLWEVVVSIFSVLYILAEEGYGMMLLWPDNPAMNGISRPLFFGIVVVFGLLFTLEYVKTEHWHKSWTALTVVGILIWTVYMILLHPFNVLGLKNEANYSTIIFFYLVICFSLCLLTQGIALHSWISDKNRNGMVIFLVFLVTGISLLIRILALQGVGSHTELLAHTGFITRGIHVPLIGGYLVYRVVIDNRKQVQERLDYLEDRQSMTQAIIENTDNERQRISMALHDSAGSIITGIKSTLQMADLESKGQQAYADKALKLTGQLQQEIRNICNDLLPNTISKIGLVPEIKRLLSNIESTYGIKTTLQTNVAEHHKVDNNISIHLYYIIRESLDNIVKYAECQSILIQYYHYPGDEIHLLVEDDGKGFDLVAEKAKGLGSGLKNISLRVDWLQGEIDLYTKDGTSLSINIPLSQNVAK